MAQEALSSVDRRGVPSSLPLDVSLSLYRVLQEALREGQRAWSHQHARTNQAGERRVFNRLANQGWHNHTRQSADPSLDLDRSGHRRESSALNSSTEQAPDSIGLAELALPFSPRSRVIGQASLHHHWGTAPKFIGSSPLFTLALFVPIVSGQVDSGYNAPCPSIRQHLRKEWLGLIGCGYGQH